MSLRRGQIVLVNDSKYSSPVPWCLRYYVSKTATGYMASKNKDLSNPVNWSKAVGLYEFHPRMTIANPGGKDELSQTYRQLTAKQSILARLISWIRG